MRPPVCRTAARLFARGPLKDAPWYESAFLRFHLWYCFLCWPYARQIEFANEAFRETWSSRTDAGKVAALKSRILARLTPE